jgi:nucleoside-diphosphate-sugar epimerase
LGAVARILIVGGGCLGRRLTAELIQSGHAVRATTRTEARRGAIEGSGAECWIGTPDRLATLRGALENVTIACWLLAGVTGAQAQVRALHGSRLELFLSQAIDTTVRGVVYDAASATVAPEVLKQGERIVRALGRRNAIPIAVLTADPGDPAGWLASARGAVDGLLLGGSAGSPSSP